VSHEVGPRLGALLAIMPAWRPDAIVNEVAEYAGPIAATAEGLPYVTAGFGPLVQPAVAARAAEATIPFWDAARTEPQEPRAYLDPCPPSLQIGDIRLLPALPVRLTRPLPPPAEPVISDGDAGPLLAALAHGLPLILLPETPDQHYNAERAVAAGAAITELDVDRLLTDGRLRAAAERVAREIAALPEPAAVIPRIVDICA
jgi:Erythromycin biosynthesis protein CIII-like, C-terminal domain